MRMSAARGLAGMLAAALLAGCGTLAGLWEASDDVALGGHDPVAYFTIGRPVRGLPEIRTGHLGATYQFANDANRRMFITNPERYAPQFGAYCAHAATFSLPVAGDPSVYKIIDGRLHLFENASAKAYFEMDQERNLTLARYYWDAELRDSNQHFQYLKRLVFRVPHYRSNAQLADEYQKRFGKLPG
jgi:hypothetical protein